MSSSAFRRAALGALVTGAAVLSAASAMPQPDVRFPADQPAPLAARVALLEQRAHRMEQRLAAFERVKLKNRPDGAHELSINGASVTIERDGRVTVIPIPPAGGDPAVTGRLPPDCEPPYDVDPTGVRIPKPSCIGANPECEPPYSLDARGIKRYKPECL